MLREWGKEGGTFTLVDVWQILYRDARIVSLFGFIVSSNRVAAIQSIPCVAEDVIGSLMLLAQESKEPIKIVINNVGGDVNDGFAIIQAMEHVKAKGIELWTVNMCQSASMAATILVMGTKGKRFVLNNTITHFHSGNAKMAGRPEDLESIYEFSKKHFTQTTYKMLLENTNIPEYWNREAESQYTEEQLASPKIRLKILQNFIQGERPLMAAQAVEAGVADKVLMPGDPIIDEIYRVSPKIKGEQGV